MRINRYQSTEQVAAAKPAVTAKTEATDKTGDASSILDDVKVSAEAKALADRAAGLERLKAQVQSGNYKVDADAIASKLVGLDDE